MAAGDHARTSVRDLLLGLVSGSCPAGTGGRDNRPFRHRLQPRHSAHPLRAMLLLPWPRPGPAPSLASSGHRRRDRLRAGREGAGGSPRQRPAEPPLPQDLQPRSRLPHAPRLSGPRAPQRPPDPPGRELDRPGRPLAAALGLPPGPQAGHAFGPESRLGSQRTRRLRPASSGGERSRTLTPGRPGDADPAGDPGPDGSAALAPGSGPLLAGSFAGRLREAGGPPAGLHPVRGAHGGSLAGSGPLRRHQRLPE